MYWKRKWQPTPVFLPGESQGRGSLVGCRLWGHTELDTTEVTAAAAETVARLIRPTKEEKTPDGRTEAAVRKGGTLQTESTTEAKVLAFPWRLA